jgi:hypothetical protein
MKARVALATFSLIVAGAFASSATRQWNPAAHFTAHNAIMTSPARLSLGAVDITISRWSTDLDRRRLTRTLLLNGHVAFMDLLCRFGRVGSIAVDGEGEMTLRYAWETKDRDGGTRVYLASDEPIRLDTKDIQFSVEPGPLTFVELRLNPQGEGVGKLAPVEWLSVDERQNVIEISNYEQRPLDLIFVHREEVE